MVKYKSAIKKDDQFQKVWDLILQLSWGKVGGCFVLIEFLSLAFMKLVKSEETVVNIKKDNHPIISPLP